MNQRLARRVLARPRRQHLAEDHFIDLLGLQARTFEQRTNHGRAEFGRGHLGERAAEFAYRGPCRGYDHYVSHALPLDQIKR